MKRNSFITICMLTLLSFVLSGCLGMGSPQPQPQQETTQNESWGHNIGPSWAMNPPQDEGAYYGSANAQSRSLNTAIDQANLRATQQVARTIRQSIQSWQEDYQQSMGSGGGERVVEAFESLSQRVVDEEIEGVEEVERAVEQEYGIYTAWVLVRYTLDDLENQFDEVERLNTEFSREEARKRLEERTR